VPASPRKGTSGPVPGRCRSSPRSGRGSGWGRPRVDPQRADRPRAVRALDRDPLRGRSDVLRVVSRRGAISAQVDADARRVDERSEDLVAAPLREGADEVLPRDAKRLGACAEAAGRRAPIEGRAQRRGVCGTRGLTVARGQRAAVGGEAPLDRLPVDLRVRIRADAGTARQRPERRCEEEQNEEPTAAVGDGERRPGGRRLSARSGPGPARVARGAPCAAEARDRPRPTPSRRRCG